MFKWSQTSTSGISADPPGFSDCEERPLDVNDEDEAEPTVKGGVTFAKLGWEPIVGSHTDNDGWMYAFTFPSIEVWSLNPFYRLPERLLQERLVSVKHKCENRTHTMTRWHICNIGL